MLEDLPCQLNMTDDILVYGANEDEHHANLLKVLDRIKKEASR